MEGNIQRLFDAVEELRANASVNSTFGPPVTVEGRTVIPVAEVGYGFGLGFGSGETGEAESPRGEGGGGGGGVQARPLGVVEVTPEGIQVKTIVDEQKIAVAGVVLVAWIVFWVARTLVAIFKK